MKKVIIFFLFALPAFFLFSPFCNAVPNLISYQGILNDAAGDPVDNETGLQMTFSIYEVASGGTALWSEVQTVPVTEGVFNVTLGDVNKDLPSELFRKESLWLGIKVGNDAEMTPRQRITSAGYAHTSEMLTEGVVPVGTIVTWMKDDPLVIKGNVTGCSSNIITDNNALFNSYLEGKSIQISYRTALSYDRTSVVFSDDQNYGILVNSTTNFLSISSPAVYQPPPFFEQTFFYADGTNAKVTVSNYTGGSYEWFILTNPYTEKPVWKIEHTREWYSRCNDWRISVAPEQNFKNTINVVNNQTQLTLKDNMAISTECTYTIWPTPGLPYGWVEMNGQTIDDTDSTYHGMTIPDTNSESPPAISGAVWIMKIK